MLVGETRVESPQGSWPSTHLSKAIARDSSSASNAAREHKARKSDVAEESVSRPLRLRRAMFLVSHSSTGGAQEMWANLADGMRRRGHTVQLAALYPNGRAERTTPQELPWKYALPERPRSVGGFLKLVLSLADMFRNEAPDIVYSALPAANVLAPIAARLAGCRCRIVTSHHSPAETYNRLLDRLDGLTGRMKNVSVIVTVSNAVHRSHEAKSRAYRMKRHTIYNALPPQIEDQLCKLSRRHDRRSAIDRTLVATGRLAPQKNYPALLRAVAHLPDIRVDIVGNGPEERYLKDLAHRLRVSDRITFHGFVQREEALNILSRGDVFVQPSLFEGHSLALVEAAKLGLPLVVSNVPVQIESITSANGEPCGMVVDANDDRQFAAEIKRLMDEPAHYAEYAQRASKLAQGISYGSMIAAYEALMP